MADETKPDEEDERTPDDDVRDMDELESAGSTPEPPASKLPDEPPHVITGEDTVLPSEKQEEVPAAELPEEQPGRRPEVSFSFETDSVGRTFTMPSFDQGDDSGLREAAEMLRDAAKMFMDAQEVKRQNTTEEDAGETPDWLQDVADQLEETTDEMREAAETMVADLREAWHDFASIKRSLETQRY